MCTVSLCVSLIWPLTLCLALLWTIESFWLCAQQLCSSFVLSNSAFLLVFESIHPSSVFLLLLLECVVFNLFKKNVQGRFCFCTLYEPSSWVVSELWKGPDMSKDLNSQLWSYLPTFNYTPAGGDLAKWVTQTIIRSDWIPVDASLQEMTYPVCQLSYCCPLLFCSPQNLLQPCSTVNCYYCQMVLNG